MVKIQFVDPALILSKNVAIVGSSGNLKKNEYGKVIDKYDDVIRFNRAPVNGYENLVGGKTTLRVANNHVIRNIPISNPKFSNQPANFIKNLKNSNILYIGPNSFVKHNDKEKYTDSSNELFIFDHNKTNKIMSSIGFSGGDPSVGLIMIGLCIYSEIKPGIFGFDINVKDQSRTHYWEERPEPGPCHDINKEKLFIKKLRDKKMVKINGKFS